LGVPQEVIDRPPTAGLWPSQTDEDEMGITYEALDQTLRAIASGNTDDIDPDTLEKVRGMMRNSAHKRAMPPVFLIGKQGE
jgi:NAD+ synthase